MKINLGEHNSLGYGWLVRCCEIYQQVKHSEIPDDGDFWECAICNQPLIIRIKGEFYEVGSNITI